MPEIALIAALDKNGVIGAEGAIPWRLPRDVHFFKETTMGKPIIMGRKTYESIGRALRGRHNIVVTRNRAYRAPGCTVVHSPEAALAAAANGAEEIMIIGGAALYEAFLPRADRLYLTFVEAEVEGDTFFPRFDRGEWNVVKEERHPADERHEYAFTITTWERQVNA
ncbi:MAG: type 3 dihydrofolate reductase [Candidatus Promineifilaceae bacterium]|nr:type 3 dihydrofolate reductase [Candidatus Promineifilaceae bacterium]